MGLKKVIFLVAITFLLYWPALHYGFFWDDHILITNNFLLGSLGGLREIWVNPFALPYAYLPVTITSFWLEHQGWGFHPMGYHFVNLLLHSANAVLLFMILSRLNVPGALFAAAVFAWHPVQMESVVWISERKNLLSFFFYGMAILSYLRFSDPSRSTHETKNPWIWYGLALIFFIGSILSKPLACFLPVTLFLLCWWKKERIGIKDLRPLLPFFIISFCVGLFSIFIETRHLGAQGLRFPWSFSERSLVAGHSLIFYIQKFFWPTHLTFLTPKWELHIHQVWYLALSIVASLTLIFGCLKTNRKGIVVGFLFFLIHLAPLLGFFNTGLMQYTFVANWWLYYSSAGLAVLLGAMFDRGISSVYLKWAVGAIILFALIQMTSRRIPEFRDEEETLKRMVREHPNVPFAHYDLAMTYYGRGKMKKAEDHLEKALELKSDYAEAHNNLAAVLLEEKRFMEAHKHLTQALNLKPDYGAAHGNLAIAYARLGDLDQAEVHFKEALRLNPYSTQLRKNVESFHEARVKLQK